MINDAFLSTSRTGIAQDLVPEIPVIVMVEATDWIVLQRAKFRPVIRETIGSFIPCKSWTFPFSVEINSRVRTSFAAIRSSRESIFSIV